jgi:hypothetical protein
MMFVLRTVALVCCFCLTAGPIFVVLFAWTANPGMFWVAIAAAAVLLLLGLLSGRKPHSYSESSLHPGSDVNTGSFAMRLRINRITGSVYIFTQIIYSAARQLRKAIAHFGSWRCARGLDPAGLGALMSELRFAPGQRRFRQVSSVSTSPELLARAVALKIVFQQQEDGEILVGLNRDYD